MKIGFIFTGTFWGIILILFGISAILRSFNINIPFFRIIFALILVYLGVALLVGGPQIGDNNFTLFNENNVRLHESVNSEHNIIFGKGNIDLRDIEIKDKDIKIEVNAIFGSGLIIIDSDTPVQIVADSAFGSVEMPDNSSISFGSSNYNNQDNETEENYLKIKASAVFGSIEIQNR